MCGPQAGRLLLNVSHELRGAGAPLLVLAGTPKLEDTLRSARASVVAEDAFEPLIPAQRSGRTHPVEHRLALVGRPRVRSCIIRHRTPGAAAAGVESRVTIRSDVRFEETPCNSRSSN